MYIALAFVPTGTTTSAQADNIVDSELSNLGFKNSFTPVTGVRFSNTPDGTKAKVDDLEAVLRPQPLSFIISASLKGWDIWKSASEPWASKARTVVNA